MLSLCTRVYDKQRNVLIFPVNEVPRYALCILVHYLIFSGISSPHQSFICVYIERGVESNDMSIFQKKKNGLNNISGSALSSVQNYYSELYQF